MSYCCTRAVCWLDYVSVGPKHFLLIKLNFTRDQSPRLTDLGLSKTQNHFKTAFKNITPLNSYIE